MKKILELFISFAKIGVLTFGGGYAMLPMLQRECVDRRSWITEDEMLDLYSLSRCIPGVVAVNTGVFIGKKLRGITGSVAAALGMITPSLVIIILISALITNFEDAPAVKNAFAGIRACVCALILDSLIKLFTPAVKDIFSWAVFVFVLLFSVFLDLSPVWYVIAAALLGLMLRGRKKE